MRARKQIEITKRDIKILEFVFEHRAVTFRQLANRFFNGASTPTVYVRLDKLRRSGLLKKSFVLWKAKRSVIFGITDKGLKQFAESYRYKITKPDFKSDSVAHDLGLVMLRERLEKTKMVVEYLSESMLQSCGQLVEHEKLGFFSRINSDAALAIETTKNKFHVALEYEISDKQESRYAKKLTEYYYSPNVAAVFYVCGDASIEKLIRNVDVEVGQNWDAKVFTCLEETTHSATGSLPFVNRANAMFSLA